MLYPLLTRDTMAQGIAGVRNGGVNINAVCHTISDSQHPKSPCTTCQDTMSDPSVGSQSQRERYANLVWCGGSLSWNEFLLNESKSNAGTTGSAAALSSNKEHTKSPANPTAANPTRSGTQAGSDITQVVRPSSVPFRYGPPPPPAPKK